MSDPEWVHVRLVRSGGLAGLRREYQLHSDSLAADTAAEFLHAATSAVQAETARPGGEAGRSGGADRYAYSLVVTGANLGTTRWQGSEASLPPAARELVRLVERLARAG